MKSDSENISLTWGFCFDRMMPKDDLGLGPRNDQVSGCVCTRVGGYFCIYCFIKFLKIFVLCFHGQQNMNWIGPHLMLGSIFPHLGRTMGRSTPPPPGISWTGPLVSWLWDNISLQPMKLTLEKLQQDLQTLEVYTFCIYRKPDGQSNRQTHLNVFWGLLLEVKTVSEDSHC